MSTLLFLYNNLIDTATLTGSSAATGFPANNLKNPLRSKPWRTLGTPAGTANLLIDLSALWANSGAAKAADPMSADLTASWTQKGDSLVFDTDHYEFTVSAAGKYFRNAVVITALTAGKLYKMSIDVKDGTKAGGTFQMRIANVGLVDQWASATKTSTASWVTHTLYFTANGTEVYYYINAQDDWDANLEFKNFSLYELTGGETDCVAMTGYNWASAPGTFNLEFNNANSWGSPSATEALTWVSATTPGGNKGSIIKTFTQKNYLYARLNVVYATGDWDLGRMFLGSYFEPARTYGWGYQESIVDPSMMSLTIGGQPHTDEIEKYRVVNCNGLIETQAQWVLYQAMINAVGTHKDFFVTFDYAGQPIERTIYGHFSETPAPTRPFYFNYDFEFTEAR